jgi:hypothetical protein
MELSRAPIRGAVEAAAVLHYAPSTKSGPRRCVNTNRGPDHRSVHSNG